VYHSFEDLAVWQRGCRLAVAIFEEFSGCKNFTIKDQIQRAGLSIPSNIAEGAERGSVRDFAHFLNISKGSCGELRTQLYIARKLKLLTKAPFDRLVAECREISAMLEGLRSSLLKSARPKQKRVRIQKLKT
jgi:four helix bundle protein